MLNHDLSFPLIRPQMSFTYEQLASMSVEEFDARLKQAWEDAERQAEQVTIVVMAELLREPVMRFAGQIENFLNHEKHRQRQWAKWRRRQARKQNRRRA